MEVIASCNVINLPFLPEIHNKTASQIWIGPFDLSFAYEEKLRSKKSMVPEWICYRLGAPLTIVRNTGAPYNLDIVEISIEELLTDESEEIRAWAMKQVGTV